MRRFHFNPSLINNLQPQRRGSAMQSGSAPPGSRLKSPQCSGEGQEEERRGSRQEEKERRGSRQEEEIKGSRQEEERRGSRQEEERRGSNLQEEERRGSRQEEEERRGSRQEEERRGSRQEEEERRGSRQEEEKRRGSRQEEKMRGSRQEEKRRGRRQEEERRGSRQEEERRGSRPEEKMRGSNLQEVKRRGKMEKRNEEEEMSERLKTLDLSSRAAAAGTGLVYSEVFTRFWNPWESSFAERPDRVTSIMEELKKQKLLPRCVRVEPREATEEELLLVHTKRYVDLMRSTQTMTDGERRTLSEAYDSVFIHPESFQAGVLAVGSVLQLVDQVMTSDLRNGFAVVRPPGHHAQASEANGYCLFNNVAIAARYARSRCAVSRVLIVDWDIHHGQGVQSLFQEDPSVLYFSIHRYEGGAFWPHLPESSSQFVGSGRAEGTNINLPWNKTAMTDSDYITAFQQLLLPVAYEFQPQLVLVSAGFDSAVGDPKGGMCVSPQCFHVLTHMLMCLAEGRLVLALEGGYNLQSTAEGAAACVRALLGGACPRLTPPTAPCDSALQSISETVAALYPYWTSLQILEGISLAEEKAIRTTTNEEGTSRTSLPPSVAVTTGLVYDERMMEHLDMWDRHHPEQPQRICQIFSKHRQLGLVDRCRRITARLATEEELARCHSVEHIELMKATAAMKPRELHRVGGAFRSVFINGRSFHSARLAAGGCLAAVETILSGQVSNGVAIVRPPGHHAERDAPCGFCLFNTAALTARHAQKISQEPPLRVLILDWDVHHGNGTQHMFEHDDSVLYISLHRYDNGTFFPCSEDAAPSRVGVSQGRGFNVNVAWSGGRMGDADYLAAFHHVVMPIATEFDPGLVLVSAGFDAARGDPLGGYHVTPEGYAHLTHLLMSLAGGRVLLILEGGYNLNSISESMAMCTGVLLGDPPPFLATPLIPVRHSAAATINEVVKHHAPYWRSLRIRIPESVRASLPSPKHRGKRRSKGKATESDKPPLPPAAREDSMVTSSEERASCSSLLSNQREQSLEQLTQGLAGLDIAQSSANPVCGTVPKARLTTEKLACGREAKAESGEVTAELNQSAESVLRQPSRAVAIAASESVAGGGGAEPEAVGACGWSKSEVSLETMFGGQNNATLYVVDPLPWCPHLDAVKPLPPSGIDVFGFCQDCSSNSENWTCLTCYQVHCGRYVNEHMVTHGAESEHPLVLSFSDLSVWCYLCEAYVHNQVLFEAKNAAHCSKFGEEIPPWS
ncbi:histone deacetylase 6 [Brachionichthys hirsutus]|uniref:histone deacetylase 6 n=1 Tax=Brachionichthys hirsutus TaxID=412623 RepID=UPI0036050EE1